MRFLAPLLLDLLICLRFATRIKIPSLPFERESEGLAGFARATRMLPLAGAVVGLAGGLALIAALAFRLPPALAALLAVAALVAASGALHEDGLADCADGFGAAVPCARKLEIMADSRIGTFGAAALTLALFARVAALAAIAGESAGLAFAVLTGAAGLSRAAALIPLATLPAARDRGAGFSARPDGAGLTMAAGLGALLAALPIIAGAAPARVLVSIVTAAAAGAAVSRLARREIGGQTGDVAGAAQQVAEICVYLVYAAQS